ncbi:MAG: [FeFe] hydrogenase H-cluster radical SAM maturase HydE [Lachnospiraceae bacterium]|nr:[FeFe] hydrogenase H-cluster radical SAM maturase HydE [Lachnospiraceae bacterium]
MYNELIEKLAKDHSLTREEYLQLIRNRDKVRDRAAELACGVREHYYGNRIFIRGLIEFSNYCKNNCYYCGIRAGNRNAERYRLTGEQIISCADTGYGLGFRTFVLQGGEDPYYTDEMLTGIIRTIKQNHPDCALTLSLGERSYESYRLLKEAGADRYLLRHETANPAHYGTMHPAAMQWENRVQCLKWLKELGYQTGAGFMVGSPGQTEEDLAGEMLFLKEIDPQMVGIGPFIPHQDTPFKDKEAGTAELTTFLLSLIRLTLPGVLLPATTALGTIDPLGREKGIEAGANVLMPNLSPTDVREKYLLYDNKICTGEEAAQCLECLKQRVRKTGCEIVTDRGDYFPGANK